MEMPDLFGHIDVYSPSLQWRPAAAANVPAANRSHPYLRSHMLATDYAIFDAEKQRLYRRARRAGLVVVPGG